MGPPVMEAPLTLNGHVCRLIAYGPGESRSGSMRQMPEVASSTHKWRKGAPVAGLMAVPFRMMPPRGAVTAAAVLFCGFGTPRYCIVVVAGVTLVWAFAVTMASIRIVTRQNKLRAESV